VEWIVILALVVALGVLAQRYGYDSRDRPRSAEERLAAAGVTWEEGQPEQEPRPAKARRRLGGRGGHPADRPNR
jgi:hypothetical protein